MGRQPNFGTPIAFGLILAALIMGYFEYRSESNESAAESGIVVSGIASETVEADRAVWKGRMVNEANSLQRGYPSVQTDRGLLEGFISDQGIDSTRLEFAPIKVQGHSSTGRTGRYTLVQEFMLRGDDPEAIRKCAQEVASLAERGVRIETESPRFSFSELDGVHDRLNALAAENAREKAAAIADSSGVELGALQKLKEKAFHVEGTDPEEGSAPSYHYTRSLEQTISVKVKAKFRFE